MTFKNFDLIDRISRRNSFLFGFHAFSKEFFQTLQLGFSVYHDSRFKKTGLAAERMSLRQCFDAIVGFRRREQAVDSLRKPKIWKSFSTISESNVILQQQLTETEHDFKHQERFATHTNESLYDAYKKLNLIEQLLQGALREVAKAKRRWFLGRIPRALLRKYRDYLVQQLATVKQEREDIVTHMLARLIQAAKDPLLENTDTLPSIIKDLKSKGFLKSSYTTPVISENTLSAKLFHKFHAIIQADGNSEMRPVLYSLPWFKNNKNMAVRYQVENLVPPKEKSPQFLFYNHNLRVHWFDDFHAYAKMDTTLHYLRTERVKGELTFDSLSHRMMSVCSAEHALEIELTRIRVSRVQANKGLRKYFNRKTTQFLDAIELALKQKAERLVNEKIELLGFINIAPMEEVQDLKIVEFVESIDASISEKTQRKFNHHMKALQKRMDLYLENQLKDYLCQWSSLSLLKELSREQLDKLHLESETQELLLMRVLPREWSFRVAEMRKLRLNNQSRCLEIAAGINLTQLLLEKPSVLQKLVKKELQYLRESLVDYLKNNVHGFDYGDQKSALTKMIAELESEGVGEAELSLKLSKLDQQFLNTFPEVHFFINIMLKLKQEENILDKIHNPKEIEDRIDGVHRFIQRQEAKYLSKNKVKFATLFCKSESASENRVLIHQLKRGLVCTNV
ncbi:MAG TPA: hypothetical protein VGV92_04080 [Gammaproteobacteria bacterium]|nr:hypothetical protein [Gammaproteobacteria bacterium]